MSMNSERPVWMTMNDVAATEWAKNATDMRWDPRFHKRRWYAGQEAEFLAEIQAANGIRFFKDIQQQPDEADTNLGLDGQTDIPRWLENIGLELTKNWIVQPQDPAITMQAQSVLDMILDHSTFTFIVRGSITVIDRVPAAMLMPGYGTAGSVSTTQTNTIQQRMQFGDNHPSAAYRFGGPNLDLIVALDKSDQWMGFLKFSKHLMDVFKVWFTEIEGESPVKLPECGFMAGLTCGNWGWKPLVA